MAKSGTSGLAILSYLMKAQDFINGITVQRERTEQLERVYVDTGWKPLWEGLQTPDGCYRVLSVTELSNT